MNSLYWDSEDEEYQCIQTTGNTTSGYCNRWESWEENHAEWEMGECECTEASTNGKYCKKWECEQEEYNKCGQSEWCVVRHEDPELNSDEYCLWCAYYDEDGYYHEYQIYVELERASCECRAESDNGNYCKEWYCLETGHYGDTEDELYWCFTESEDGSHCSTYRALVDGVEEFEFAKCKCDETYSSPIRGCRKWSCFEKGMSTSFCSNRPSRFVGAYRH